MVIDKSPSLGRQIRAARAALGLSQESLAHELRTSQGCVSSWETGVVHERTLTAERLVELATVLEVEFVLVIGRATVIVRPPAGRRRRATAPR